MKKLCLLLAAFHLAGPLQAQVTFPDAVTSNLSTEARASDPSFAHTVTSGTTLVLAFACGDGAQGHDVNGVTGAGVTWSQVYRDNDSTSGNSAALEIWGAVSPGVGATTIAVDYFGHTVVDGDYIAVINVHGTVVTNVAAAIQLLSQDLNNADGSAAATSTTSVHASGGTLGNHLLFSGCAIAAGSDGGTNDAGFAELLDADTGGGQNSAADKSILIAHKAAPSAITHTWGRDDDNVSGLFELVAAEESAPEFTSAPALDDCDATSCTFDFTPDTAGTIWAAAYTTGASAPADCAAVEAGSGAEDTATDTVTTSADSITLDSVLPEQDYYFCLEDGDENVSEVASVLNQKRDARTGFEFIDLTSVSGTSVFADTDYFDPDVATGDIIEAVSATDPGSFAITWGADGEFEYTDATASRQSIDYCIQDVSDSTGEFTTPACWTTDDTIWVNDVPIVCTDDEEILVFDEDEAITPFDLDDDCTDEDQPTYAVTDGTLPNGLTLTGASGEVSGTPDTEDEAGVFIEFTATGAAGDTDTLNKLMYVVNTVTLPDMVGSDLSLAIDAMESAFPWRVDDLGLTATFTCHESEAANDVISQDPVATTEVTAFEEVSVVVSTGVCGESRKKRRVCLGLGLACRD